MLGFRPKLPVTDEERQWVNDGFNRLCRLLGRDRMLNAEVVLPADEYFPDQYDGTEAALERLFQRICGYTQEVYGYALAKFASERREDRPEWAKHLTTNVRAYYKRSRAWLLNSSDRNAAATGG